MRYHLFFGIGVMYVSYGIASYVPELVCFIIVTSKKQVNKQNAKIGDTRIVPSFLN